MDPKLIEEIEHSPSNTRHEIRFALGEALEQTRNAFQQLNFPKEWINQLQKAKNSVIQVHRETTKSLSKAIDATTQSFLGYLDKLHLAEEYTKKMLMENVALSSVLGEHLDDLWVTSKIQFSFRDQGQDITPKQLLDLFYKSGKKEMILFIPGLFCDEKSWQSQEDGIGAADFLEENGYFPAMMRYNPGLNIYVNGNAFNQLMREIHQLDPALRFHIVTYSQGGLVFRSALYEAKKNAHEWIHQIDKAVLVSSPDGGSYIEKVGFWVATALQSVPVFALQILGIVGNMRSSAMKDLSHGLIREEDSNKSHHLDRYFKERYFGELDEIDAYQIYSMIGSDGTDKDKRVDRWIGDGVIERPSLLYLTERVFLKKNKPESRSYCLAGHSHFSILRSRELTYVLDQIFPARGIYFWKRRLHSLFSGLG